jgi:hypothetical protein
VDRLDGVSAGFGSSVSWRLTVHRPNVRSGKTPAIGFQNQNGFVMPIFTSRRGALRNAREGRPSVRSDKPAEAVLRHKLFCCMRCRRMPYRSVAGRRCRF